MSLCLCEEWARETLERHGWPLVMFQPDGVLVCKEGTWAHAKTLKLALADLGAKLKERAR